MINSYHNTAHLVNLHYNLFEEENDQIQFFLEKAKFAKGNILELGCGYGRILIPIVKTGKSITGIDHSRKMLNELENNLKALSKAERNRINLIECDFREFHLKHHFDLIFSCDKTFCSFFEESDRRKALRSVHRHLTHQGVLIFDSIDITNSRIEEIIGQKIHLWTKKVKNQLIKKFTLVLVYDKKQGIIKFLNSFEITQEDGKSKILEDELLMFVGAKEKIISLVESENFIIDEIIEGYPQRSKDLIFICKPVF